MFSGQFVETARLDGHLMRIHYNSNTISVNHGLAWRSGLGALLVALEGVGRVLPAVRLVEGAILGKDACTIVVVEIIAKVVA